MHDTTTTDHDARLAALRAALREAEYALDTGNQAIEDREPREDGSIYVAEHEGIALDEMEAERDRLRAEIAALEAAPVAV